MFVRFDSYTIILCVEEQNNTLQQPQFNKVTNWLSLWQPQFNNVTDWLPSKPPQFDNLNITMSLIGFHWNHLNVTMSLIGRFLRATQSNWWSCYSKPKACLSCLLLCWTVGKISRDSRRWWHLFTPNIT